MHSIDSLDASEYGVSDIIECAGPPVDVHDRMTKDEVERDLIRVGLLDNQLQELNVTVQQYGLHGKLRRVSAVLKPGHDPLRNGILVGNVDGFSVEAVQPDRGGPSAVGIRFQGNPE